jgi:phosphoribosylamine--glycine ligase / phosphoribosylformylglycinamidine cyclo-ligase
MEGSKAFAKDFMSRNSIPTAQFRTFTNSQFQDAVAYVKQCPYPVVIKADGLAAGKGVIIPDSVEQAVEALQQLMVDKTFGDAGTPSTVLFL